MNAKELGDMPAFPLPVIKDDKGHPMVHAHPYNQGMTVRQVAVLSVLHALISNSEMMDEMRALDIQDPHVVAATLASKQADALLALLAKDAE